ncbi:MAG TPA: L-threonylcarbamoyladenylate synthase [Acidimicrobiia bacterium]|nr:L-threonylcarbamoyladenylate synthase [Acidimicrobiia bacterium]
MSLAGAVAAIRRGEVVGVPTDTVYGLAVDPWNEEAVDRLFELKGRPAHKPIGLLAADADQAGEIADLAPAADLLDHWPGALTLVVRPKVVIPDWVGNSALGTVGIRVPDHDMLRELLEETGPLAVTSANLSGMPEALSDEEAKATFGDAGAVYLPGRCPGGTASTVVDVTGPVRQVLRAGPVLIAEDD